MTKSTYSLLHEAFPESSILEESLPLSILDSTLSAPLLESYNPPVYGIVVYKCILSLALNSKLLVGRIHL